jgi:glyoxylase I family protein
MICLPSRPTSSRLGEDDPRSDDINKVVTLAPKPSLARVRNMLDAIHHVALICTDYDRSRRFYVELLGLDLIREVYREERQSWKADLRIGFAQLELFSFPAPVPRPSYPEATGLRHLAFAVMNLDPVVVRLEAAGVAVEPIRIDPYTDRRFTFFSDPDGLPLELYEAQ